MRIGVSLGIGGLAARQRLAATPPPTPAPTLTMTQPADTRIYQRATTTGGANGKGVGSIPLAITIDQAATVEYRLRDAVTNGNPTLQDWTSAGSVAANATTAICPNVPAGIGWYYVDLRANGGAPVLGTARVGMGRLIAMAGQSQAVRQFAKMPAYTGTNASLGVAVDSNSSVYARYTDSSRTLTTPAWAIPADSSNYDSTFVAEFLRRQVAEKGVNCGVIGHAVGSTAIAAWQPGQANNAALRAVLDAAGGFEAFYWHHGGDDAGAGTTAAAYQSGLSGVFGDLAGHNAARGSSFERYVTAMATRLTGGAGNASSVQTIRKAASDWAASNSATYLEPHDVTLEDDVHQGQPGNIILARHVHRAASSATDVGPTINSGTRSGATITLTASAALSMVGNPANRFTVYPTGTVAGALAVSGVAVSGTTITLTLSADPGTTALDVYWLRHPDPSGTTAAANMIYDTYAADGIVVGRQLQPTLAAPVAIAAVAATPTPTPMSAKINFADPTYAANPAGWNRWNAPQQAAVARDPTPVTLAILDPSGAATPWTATVTAPSDYGYGQPGTTTGNNSGIVPDDILLKYWYNSATPTTFQIAGLTVGKSYTASLIGSRGATGRPVIYTVNGVSQTFEAGNNTASASVFTFTATGTTVAISFTKGAGASFGYLNGMIFVQNN